VCSFSSDTRGAVSSGRLLSVSEASVVVVEASVVAVEAVSTEVVWLEDFEDLEDLEDRVAFGFLETLADLAEDSFEEDDADLPDDEESFEADDDELAAVDFATLDDFCLEEDLLALDLEDLEREEEGDFTELFELASAW